MENPVNGERGVTVRKHDDVRAESEFLRAGIFDRMDWTTKTRILSKQFELAIELIMIKLCLAQAKLPQPLLKNGFDIKIGGLLKS